MGLGDGGWGGGGGGAEGEVLFVVMQCLLLLTGTDSYITHALSLLWAGRGGGGGRRVRGSVGVAEGSTIQT